MAGAAELHAVVRARMDEFVMDDEVAALRQRREQRGVGGEAGREEERGLAAIMARGVGFERLMLGVVAAQQARAAPARGKAGSGRAWGWQRVVYDGLIPGGPGSI